MPQTCSLDLARRHPTPAMPLQDSDGGALQVAATVLPTAGNANVDHATSARECCDANCDPDADASSTHRSWTPEKAREHASGTRVEPEQEVMRRITLSGAGEVRRNVQHEVDGIKLHLSTKSTTGYRGVSYKPSANSSKPYQSVGPHPEGRHLGYFTTALDAARAFANYVRSPDQYKANEQLAAIAATATNRQMLRDRGVLAEAQGYELHLSNNSKSGYVGVRFDKYHPGKPYKAEAQVRGQKRSLGYHATAIDAAVAVAKCLRSGSPTLATLNPTAAEVMDDAAISAAAAMSSAPPSDVASSSSAPPTSRAAGKVLVAVNNNQRSTPTGTASPTMEAASNDAASTDVPPGDAPPNAATAAAVAAAAAAAAAAKKAAAIQAKAEAMAAEAKAAAAHAMAAGARAKAAMAEAEAEAAEAQALATAAAAKADADAMQANASSTLVMLAMASQDRSAVRC